MEGEDDMIIKTKLLEPVIRFLNENIIVNLNIIGFIENETDVTIYVDNEKLPTGVVAIKGYFSFIFTENDQFLDEVLNILYKDGYYGFSGVYRLLAQKIKKKFKIEWESRCALYYYPGNDINTSLIKNPVQCAKISDAETIDYYYTYKDETSFEKIKDDLEKRHSSAVYVNGDIACWVLTHNDNSMGIMYTREEYRKKGYAVDVTIDLTKKILKSGRVPFLQITQDNIMSPGLAKKCGFIHDGIFSDWFGIIAPKQQ
jgi:hypothetical protein